MRSSITRLTALMLGASALSACAATDRLSYVGQTPPMSPMANVETMTGGIHPGVEDARSTEARQIATMRALHEARGPQTNPGSLWQLNAQSFFGDPRASQVGDILTVSIDISDRAQVSNQTNRSRSTSTNSRLTNIFGGEAALDEFFNDAIDPSSVADFGSDNSTQGAGTVNRSETINLTAAAIVVDVMWNGNMIVQGRQEVRINNEVRELLISGIVRPQDIDADNTIDHTKIAEARISYGGRGHISDMQRPPIGQELYTLLWPF